MGHEYTQKKLDQLVKTIFCDFDPDLNSLYSAYRSID